MIGEQMSTESVQVLIVGGGQAGLAMSEHLGARGIGHLILERGRLAERWRTERWDSLVANGPAWHDRFPGLEFSDLGADDFAGKDRIAEYFEQYAQMIGAPIRSGVEVTSVRRLERRAGFRAQTTDGTVEARYVVAATGPFQVPSIPPIVPDQPEVLQLHSSRYRNPTELPDGAVLVVGAGSSGVQIADELNRSGRRVYLSVGPHDRPPRRYRGRDFVWWLGVLGKWDAAAPPQGAEHVTIAVSGAYGGRTIDFRELAAGGVTLVGSTTTFADGSVHFAGDLAANIAQGDANYLSLLEEADAYVEQTGIELPPEPEAHQLGEMPLDGGALSALRLDAADVSTIIWATGFTQDYSWLQVEAFDADGRPRHHRGVSSEPGVYFLGLPWLANRGSSFIWGVWHDARHLAEHIAIRDGYLAYERPSAPARV